MVAVLRATESASLFQQIIGRGLRLYDNKADCLVLDYANNIERHGLQKDLFTPDIKAYKKKNQPCLALIVHCAELLTNFQRVQTRIT